MDLYARYGPALLRKAERILGNRHDAQDVVQGLFIDMVAHTHKRPSTDLPYLYRAVTNRCLNFLRDRGNRRRLLDTYRPSLQSQEFTPCDEEVIGNDLLVKLAQRLDKVSFEIVIARFFDDMSVEEIATQTGLSTRTIGKRLHHLRDEIRQLRAARGGG